MADGRARPGLNPIVYAIPVFFVLMGLEWWLVARRGSRTYRLGDSVTSIGLGVFSQLLGLFTRLIPFGIYVFVYEHARVLELSASAWWVWVVGLVLYDFCYYWHHRLGHEVGVLWAAHVVHHQSEEFNLGTALRQTSSGFLLGWVFYVPMALLGFPPIVFAVVALIDLLYQYWIHTELIGRLGWFDRVFASPSNHRVHHAVNDRYLDKNYGGILIVWDRLFGTFIDEDAAEPVVYGTRSPLRSFDPLWANVEVYAALARDSWRAKRWRDKLRVWLAPPGWRPADVAAADPKPPFSLAGRVKYAPPASFALQVHVFAQFVLVIAAATFTLAISHHGITPWLVASAAWPCLSLWGLCGLMQGRAMMALEFARLLAAIAVVAATGTWFGATLSMPWRVAVLIALGASLVTALWAAREGSRETSVVPA